MSLTSHLRAGDSPVRAWFADRLANTATVSARANRELRAGVEACPLPSPDGSDRALVGTAVDLLLRAALAIDGIAADAALLGATALAVGRLPSSAQPPSIALARTAIRDVQAVEPWRRALSANEMRVVCERALVLAKLEQCFRAGPALVELVRPAVLASAGNVDRFLAAAVSPASVEDLEQLAPAVIQDHEDLRTAKPLALNPTFSLSAAVGGADADMLAAGLLLDLKATATTRVVGRDELWQLAGYALLDHDDRYGIHSVGISALRWRRWVTWPVDRLLSELSGRALPLDRWRREFAAVLASSAG